MLDLYLPRSPTSFKVSVLLCSKKCCRLSAVNAFLFILSPNLESIRTFFVDVLLVLNSNKKYIYFTLKLSGFCFRITGNNNVGPVMNAPMQIDCIEISLCHLHCIKQQKRNEHVVAVA